MIILSVDYGDARTGIAVCDKLEMLATPLCVIKEADEDKLVCKIKEIAEEHSAGMIVVGLPRNMDGSFGARAEKCTAFAGKLKDECQTEVDMFDERLTTVISYQSLNGANVYGKKSKSVVDAVAATTILQDYLSYRKNKKS